MRESIYDQSDHVCTFRFIIERTTAVFFCATIYIGTSLAFENQRPAEAGQQKYSGDRSRPTSSAVLEGIFGKHIVAGDVYAIRERCVGLTDAERFERLADWVLPSETHVGIRLSGEFTATHPSPVAFRPELHSKPAGAELVSPVFDMVIAAKQTGRLEELRRRIDALQESNDTHQRRCAAVLQAIVSLESGDTASANRACQMLGQ